MNPKNSKSRHSHPVTQLRWLSSPIVLNYRVSFRKQVGAPLEVLEHAKDPVFNFLPLSQCRKMPQMIRISRKPHFGNHISPTGNKKPIFRKKINFLEKSHSAEKKLSAQKTTFSQAKIHYGNGTF